jgi:hypothetical protein
MVTPDAAGGAIAAAWAPLRRLWRTHSPGGRHDAVRLGAAVPVSEDELAIAVEEVRDAERAHLGGEGLDDGEARREQGRHRALPDLDQTIKQQAEAFLRIGLADGMEAMDRPGEQTLDAVEAAVVGKKVYASAQLAHERLGVGVAVAADRGAADVRDQELRGLQMVLDEAQQNAVAGGLRLLEQAHVATVMEGHAPAVDIARVGRTMGGEVAQRERSARRLAARKAEKLAHGVDDTIEARKLALSTLACTTGTYR